MDFSSLDDAALLKAIAKYYGKASSEEPLNSAVGTLYDRFGRLVFSVAIRMVGDTETAEEITQDVFVRVCESAGGYQSGMAKVSTWMVSITRHRAIDELRRRNVRPEKNLSDWPDEAGLEEATGLPISDGPERAVEQTLQAQNIREIVAGLPPDQQLALQLAYFKGLKSQPDCHISGRTAGHHKIKSAPGYG